MISQQVICLRHVQPGISQVTDIRHGTGRRSRLRWLMTCDQSRGTGLARSLAKWRENEMHTVDVCLCIVGCCMLIVMPCRSRYR